jgi:death-on-curing family protein
MDIDEALVTLWDNGFDSITGPDDILPSRDAKKARNILGVVTRRELKLARYWCELLAINRDELQQIIGEYGLVLTSQASVVPNGSVSQLMAEARRRGIDPLTGKISKIPEPSKLPIEVETTESREKTPKVIHKPFHWEPTGHCRDSLKWLTEKQVESIHFALVKDFSTSPDPIEPPGVRNRHLFASAIFRPQTSLDNVLKYPTVESSAAALLHSIIQDHPFHNGNKRTAIVSMLVVLDENGINSTCNEDELFKLVLQTAQHKIVDFQQPFLSDREVAYITEWICDRSRVLEKGERQIPWRRLKRILRGYECKMSYPSVGNRINIDRKSERKSFLRKRRIETLRTQVHYRDDGSEVGVDVIKKIREDLKLDELNGIDSHDFYDKEPAQAEDFIAHYRKILVRLSRL